MTAEIIKERLRECIKHYELEQVFRFFNETLDDTALLANLTTIELSYRNLQSDIRKNKLSDEQTNLRQSQLTYQLFEYVERLADANIAHTTSHLTWVKHYLDAEIEKKLTPEVDYLVNKIAIPESISRDKEKQQHFKLLMMRCQDDIAVGNFTSAYQYCLAIKNYIEAESAQLYECLLVSYFQREGADRIVKSALNGDEARLKHLVQYTNRYKKLDRSDTKLHNTGETNIKWVAQELFFQWKELYHYAEEDFILKGTADADIEKIKICIDSMQTIFDIFDDKTDFLTLPLKEWVGCGRLQWIRVEDDWELSNFRNGIGALARVEEIELRLNYDKALMASILYPFLLQKYDSIKGEIQLANQQAMMWRWWEVAKICYKLTNETGFLQLMLTEIKGKDVLAWYELNDLEEVEHSSWLKDYKRKVEYDLAHICDILGEDIDQVRQEIRKNAIDAYIEKVNDAYEAAKVSKDRKQIIKCLQQWEICYSVTKNRIFFEKCFAEIYGETRILEWFELDEKGFLKPHQEATQLNYQVLYQYFQWREDYLSDLTASGVPEKIPMFEISDKAAWVALKIDLAQKMAAQTEVLYATLRTPKYPLTPQQAITCLKQWQTCYFVLNEPVYLQKCLEEVYENQTISWFTQLQEGQPQPNEQCEALGFSVRKQLDFWADELCKNKSDDDKEVYYLEIHRREADLRKQLLGKMIAHTQRKKGGYAPKAVLEKVGK